MREILRTLIATASICLLTSAAHAGDQGDPAQSCDGNTNEMVECLKAKTAQWDKRMTVAYRKTAQNRLPLLRNTRCEGTIARIDAGECMRSMTEARARELEGLGHK